MNGPIGGLSTMRLYGSIIGLVSGGYSIYLSTGGAGMRATDWLMLLLGIVVIGHGAVLLTPAAERIGTASGPLMVGYAVLMLLNQGWMRWMRADDMDGMGMNGMGGPETMAGGQGVDAGMIALAVLMLVSGIIMFAGSRSTATHNTGMME